MISLVTSLYKSDNYLDFFAKNLKQFAKALDAAGQKFELIVIANDPTEKERNFEKTFLGESWFSFYSVAREPLYASWNRGVGLAKGEAVGFWNVDDVRFVEAVIESQQLLNNGYELIYFPFKISRYVKVFKRSWLIHKQLINKQVLEFSPQSRINFVSGMLCGPFFIFSKELYKQVGPFDEQFKIAGDFDWCARAAKLSDRLIKAKNIAGEFRVDGTGLSAGGSARQVVENNIVMQRQNILQKIQPQDELLAKEYNYKVIQGNGKKIQYD